MLSIEQDRLTQLISRRKLQEIVRVTKQVLEELKLYYVALLIGIIEQRRKDIKAKHAQVGSKGRGIGGRAATEVNPTDLKQQYRDLKIGRTAVVSIDSQPRAKSQGSGLKGEAKGKDIGLTLVSNKPKDSRQTAAASRRRVVVDEGKGKGKDKGKDNVEGKGNNKAEAEAEGKDKAEGEDEAEVEAEAEDVEIGNTIKGDISVAQTTRVGSRQSSRNAVDQVGVVVVSRPVAVVGSTYDVGVSRIGEQGKSSNDISRTYSTVGGGVGVEVNIGQVSSGRIDLVNRLVQDRSPTDKSYTNSSGLTTTNKRSIADSSSSLLYRPNKRSRVDKSQTAASYVSNSFNLASRMFEREEVKTYIEAIAAKQPFSYAVLEVLVGIGHAVDTLVYNLRVVLKLTENSDLLGKHPAEPRYNQFVRRTLSALDTYYREIIAYSFDLPHPLERPIHINRQNDGGDIGSRRDGIANEQGKSPADNETVVNYANQEEGRGCG